MVANALAKYSRAAVQRLPDAAFCPMRQHSYALKPRAPTPPGSQRNSVRLPSQPISLHPPLTLHAGVRFQHALHCPGSVSSAHLLGLRPVIASNGLSTRTSYSIRHFTSTLRKRSDPQRETSHGGRVDRPDADVHSPKAQQTAKEDGYHFLNRLPDLSQRFHRPTKEELLAAATGFWSRLRVRFKWFSIRSVRPFNVDEISAFVTWILAGHLVWILLGTTTFFSLLILTVNTVFAQGSPPWR